MKSRTTRVSQTIIQVEVDSPKDSMTGDGRQATLTPAERGRGAYSRKKINVGGNALPNRHGLDGILTSNAVAGCDGLCLSRTGNHAEIPQPFRDRDSALAPAASRGAPVWLSGQAREMAGKPCWLIAHYHGMRTVHQAPWLRLWCPESPQIAPGICRETALPGRPVCQG
jgi:hypothetical protein